MKGQWSTTYEPYTTAEAWCMTDATVAHLPCLMPSAPMAVMTVTNLILPLSQFHLTILHETRIPRDYLN